MGGAILVTPGSPPPFSLSSSENWSLNMPRARRERNRKAQHDYRRRRQAEGQATLRRIQHLEKTIEDLSNVLIDLCDKILRTEEIARHPGLMAQLQNSTMQALDLARSTSSWSETVVAQVPPTRGDWGEGHDGKSNKDESPDKRPRREILGPDSSLTGEGLAGDLDERETSSSNLTVALVEQAWPHACGLPPDIDFFPLLLVRVTLSQAYRILSGETPVHAEKMEKTFGSMLRLCTRQQLVNGMRWILNPGRSNLYQAIGINWDYATAEQDNGQHMMHPGYSSGVTPEFITAFGVHNYLHGLGAKAVDPDTIELGIIGQRCPESAAKKSDSLPTAFPTTNERSLVAPTRLVVRLSTSRLATNLACVAKCWGKGPVYPRHELARAVEAAVILARDG
ncbi:hypothetical protein LCI18_004424 [Fusarium solani-melongenae]|uniref:Uncharacterized protein n=1 Tax=Fusarium solani subsp. cucurbitae TaxID=2747967 RepID=A0ACD3YWZ1_FUSSC|nr:hypothetical protein LCI18_004424 [Fusarium solani-melongenae]